ncbi:ExbD/TolR family protein [Prosthecobacter sp.]|uniref:ExbD/TolR family protein n=1 Tax=Prosthecobacter sp. TaxID=1965333 RepID=UPI0037835632
MNLRPKRRPVPMIPIVSLIDIMVILLIFFVATTTFRKENTQVKITLPESKTMGEAGAEAGAAGGHDGGAGKPDEGVGRAARGGV